MRACAIPLTASALVCSNCPVGVGAGVTGGCGYFRGQPSEIWPGSLSVSYLVGPVTIDPFCAHMAGRTRDLFRGEGRKRKDGEVDRLNDLIGLLF